MKACLLVLLLALTAGAEPRAINPAERAAIGVVAELLVRGPEAIFDHLSPDAPLRALSREDALAELAARTGPTAGALWTLQAVVAGNTSDVAFHVTYPSGFEDGLLFRMNDGGVHEVLTLAEDPTWRAPIASPASEPPDVATRNKYLLTAAALALLCAFVASRSRVLAASAIRGAGIAMAGAFYRLRNPFVKIAQPVTFVELRALAPLRDQLARGHQPQMPRALSDAAREVARLWLGDPSSKNDNLPLAAILYARQAITQGKAAEAASAFTHAIEIQPLRDDLVVEAATSFGVSPAALPFLRDARFDESRDARLHYARAMRAVSDGDEVKGHEHFRIAWALKPIAREELLREPRLRPLLGDVATLSTISFYSPEEPLIRSPRLGKTPMAFPSGAQSFTSGELLTVHVGKGTLEIPGGATLAPANAHVIPAKREQEEDAAKLLAMTNDVTPKSAIVSPRMLVLRFQALLRARRLAEAQALANGPAVKDLVARTTFPATILTIADLMTAHGAWDTAEALYREIDSDEHQSIVELRLRQIELRRALATNGIVIATPHFDVRHDPTMNPAIASRIGELLEAEYTRVSHKLGVAAEPRRVTVNVLYWDDFRGSITGVDAIVGLYDGEILFPFAVVNQFKPELVAIITHELTHALVAAATGDNAPRWFQEGIAERMELVPQQENAFHDTAPQLILPLQLLDAVMENTGDVTMNEQAYRVAQTFIRYLENRYGANAIPQLIASFAAGKNSDEALTALTGKSREGLNRDFRAWGFANSANFSNDEPFPYRELYSPGVDPRIKAGFKWSRRPPR
jgi:hypothetical protein